MSPTAAEAKTEQPKTEQVIELPKTPEPPKERTDLEKLLDTIVPVDTATSHTKAVFYGEFGTSKTVAACTAPGRVLLVAVERGQKSLQNHPEIASNVDVMMFRSLGQINALTEQLRAGRLEQYETIVIDTFSELQKVALDVRIDEEARRDPNRNRFTPEGKDYQTNTEQMRRMAAAFRDVDRNIVFVCHEVMDKEEATGRVFLRPDLTPKVAKKLAEYCDVIGRFTSELDDSGKPIFKMQVRPSTRVVAKTRIANLPTIVENPTFNVIFNANKENSK